MYTVIHAHVYTYTYTYIYIYLDFICNVYSVLCICIYVYTHLYTHPYIRKKISYHMYPQISSHIYIYVCNSLSLMYVCMKNVYMYIHIYTENMYVNTYWERVRDSNIPWVTQNVPYILTGAPLLPSLRPDVFNRTYVAACIAPQETGQDIEPETLALTLRVHVLI